MDVSKHIDRAEKEVARKNYDLAISLFDQILALDPDNGPARAGKRRAELKKFGKSYPSKAVSGIKNSGYLFGMGFGKLLRAHGMVANLAEKALGNDPRNVKLNLQLGQALLRAGHRKGAEAAFAVVTEFDPNDIESLKTLGELYYDGKKWDEALDCFERVLKISPRDQVAIKMRKNLAAEGAIKSGGFDKAKSARELARSQEQLDQNEKRQKLVRTADDLAGAVTELRQEVEADGDNADLWLRLGNLCLQQKDLPEAAKAYGEALRLRPNDFETQTRLGDVKLQEFDEKIRELKEEVRDGEEGADDMLRRVVRERRSFRVDEFKRRVAAHPTDTSLRFKLGQYLLDDDHVDEAIAEFQVVVKDPKRKFRAMTLMGHAFSKKGLWDLATKQLTQALEGSGGANEKTLDMVHALAKAWEEQGDHEKALEYYSQIYEIDISFKDVGKKIESLSRKN